MRFLIRFGLVGLTLAAAASPPVTDDFLVVPGRSVGHLQLGDTAATLSTLGKAAFGDAAMQKAWGTWYGHPTIGTAPSELDVYTAPQNNDVGHHTVQVIRATSPWLHLANGLRPGCSLGAIRAAYGQLPLVATFRLADGPHHLYDDAAHGIAFETDTTASFGCCQAVIVHQAGKLLMQNYLSMPEYLKQVPPAK